MRFFLEFVAAIMLGILLTIVGYGAWQNAAKPKPRYSTCRPPDIGTEYRILIQTRDERGLHETCSIEPINPDEGRIKTMKRLLKRIHESEKSGS